MSYTSIPRERTLNMKLTTYILIILLVMIIGIAAVFYFNIFQPMALDYARMKEGLPILEKAKTELKQYRDREIKESAWISPTVDILSSGLSDEIKAGKAEVFPAGNRVVANISEDELYLPASSAFRKDSTRLRLTLAALLRKNELTGKEIYIGNTTEDVLSKHKGKKKIPAKDARTLAAERSASLIKDLEKNGVSKDALIGAAYSSKQPDIGSKLKSRKTILVVDNPPVASSVVKQPHPAQQMESTPSFTVKTPGEEHLPRSGPIPIRPALPKEQ